MTKRALSSSKSKTKLQVEFEKAIKEYKERTHSLFVPHLHEAKSLVKLVSEAYESSETLRVKLFKYIMYIENEDVFVCYRYAWKWNVTKKDPVRVVYNCKR